MNENPNSGIQKVPVFALNSGKIHRILRRGECLTSIPCATKHSRERKLGPPVSDFGAILRDNSTFLNVRTRVRNRKIFFFRFPIGKRAIFAFLFGNSVRNSDSNRNFQFSDFKIGILNRKFRIGIRIT